MNDIIYYIYIYNNRSLKVKSVINRSFIEVDKLKITEYNHIHVPVIFI